MTPLGWRQPCCEGCWKRKADSAPQRVTEHRRERCAWCGKQTCSGIYVRADPTTVLYPAESEPPEEVQATPFMRRGGRRRVGRQPRRPL